MAENEWNCWKGLQIPGIAEMCWKLLDRAKNGCKYQEMARNSYTSIVSAGMAGSGWKLLEMAEILKW